MPNVKKQIEKGKHAAKNHAKAHKKLTANAKPLTKAEPQKEGNVGRPTLYSTDLCGALVESGSKGLTRIQFCAGIGISKDTFYAWQDKYPEFKEAVKIYEAKIEAWYTSLVKNKMMGIQQNITDKDGKLIGKMNLDLGGLVWFGKNVCDWTEKREQTITVGTQIVEVSKEENNLIS